MFADLHIHSVFSDGSRSPEEIVSEAEKARISLLSICDHYTVGSYERLDAACAQSSISYILGVEMAAILHDKDCHVLAYGFDSTSQDMLDLIKRQHDKSEKECEAMITGLSADYPQISLSDYLAYECPSGLGGWKYQHYAVERGIFETYEEAGRRIFSKYFVAGHESCTVEEFCDIVKRANGIPVIAHPGNRDPEKLILFLRDLQARGIEGVECFYPSHSDETTETCLDYCHRNDLRITGGSDCHGAYDKTEGYSMGAMRIPLEMLDLKGMV